MPLLALSASCICSVWSGGAVSPWVWGAPWPRSAFLMVGFGLLFHHASSWVFGSPVQPTSPVCFLRSYGFSALGCCFILGSGLSLIRCCPCALVVLLLSSQYAASARVSLSALLALTGLAPSLPMRLCVLRLVSGPLGWRPVFLSVCACCAYSLALWAGAVSSYLFVLVAPILWPSGLAPCVPIRLCLLRLFSGPLGWHPVFLSVCACCAYSLTRWAGALCSYLFVFVAPILWPLGLAPCVSIRLCLLRLFSGPLGWRPVFLSVCACCALCLLRLFSGPLGWRPVFLSVCACCAYSLALWAGALCSYRFVLVAPILWPSGLAPCVPICLYLLRLFSGPLGWRPVFLSVCACCAYSLTLWAGALCSYLFVPVAPIPWPSGLAPSPPISLCLLVYSLALWAGALCSYPFVLLAPILWPSGLAPCVSIRLCLLRLFSGPLGWRPVFLSVCACCAYSLALWAGALCSYQFVLVAPILWPSGLAPCVPICLCLLRLFSGPMGWRPVFLSVCACCAYSLALWAGALCSYLFVLVAPILWPSGLAPAPPISLCLLRLFPGPLGWRPVFLSVCACCAYSLALWAGALSSYPVVLVAPILWPSGLAPCVPICLCLLRHSLALWAGILWSAGLAFFYFFSFSILCWFCV